LLDSAMTSSPTEALRWPADQAKEWFRSQSWKRGANFIPSTASNQIEMWMNFDMETIERELDWASALQYNAIRVFLHHLMYENEREDFLDKMDKFLNVASSKGIQTMFVLLDGCWDPEPSYGAQPEPRPFVHNSRWLQSPGRDILRNESAHEPNLRSYVSAVLGRFGNDSRVLLWDLYNEADNPNRHSYGPGGDTRVPVAADAKGSEMEAEQKTESALSLLAKVTDWARLAGPFTVPLTVGTWEGASDGLQAFALSQMDIVSFHIYEPIGKVKDAVSAYINDTDGRPLVCSEYMARPLNSTFDPVLGYFAEQDIWAFNWGFVNGKSQTIYPWDSWTVEYKEEPKMWFHDVLRNNGSAYVEAETLYLTTVFSSKESNTGSLPGGIYAVIGLLSAIAVVSLVVGGGLVLYMPLQRHRGNHSHEAVGTEDEVELPEMA